MFRHYNTRLHPITYEEQRETLSKPHLTIGGSTKKYRTQHTFENGGIKLEIYVHIEGMSLYGLLERANKET